jgi:hypothetical protein
MSAQEEMAEWMAAYGNEVANLVEIVKNKIVLLTDLAREAPPEYMPGIASTIVTRTRERKDPDMWLPCLYLMDSIVKNEQRAIRHFEAPLLRLFKDAYSGATKTQMRLDKLLKTWGLQNTFPTLLLNELANHTASVRALRMPPSSFSSSSSSFSFLPPSSGPIHPAQGFKRKLHPPNSSSMQSNGAKRQAVYDGGGNRPVFPAYGMMMTPPPQLNMMVPPPQLLNMNMMVPPPHTHRQQQQQQQQQQQFNVPRHRSAVDALYQHMPMQCKTCGMRQHHKQAMNKHMDWHWKTNAAAERRERSVVSREWLARDEAWCLGTDEGMAGGPAGASQEGDQEAGPQGTGAVDANAFVAADDSQKTCPVCNEDFVQEFDDDEDAWVFISAARVPPVPPSAVSGKIVHTQCL